MKHVAPLLCFLIICTCALAGESVTIVAAKPQDGVYANDGGPMATVIELKADHFRYWLASPMVRVQGPEVKGDYAVSGNTITLNAKAVSQSQWVCQTVNGTMTLWRPDAVRAYKQERNLTLSEIKKLGDGGVLFLTSKSAEEIVKQAHSAAENIPAQPQPR